MKSHAAAQTREQRQASHPDTRPLAVSQAHAAVTGPVSAGAVFADQRPVQGPVMQAAGRWQAIADQSDSALQLQAWQTRMDNSPAALQMQARAGILQAHARKNLSNISNNRHKLHGSAQPDASASASRTGLPHQLKSGIESLSGISLDAVRVHYNSAQPAQLHAHAYAQGNNIHLGPGQEQHLPHEAWHVVQQAQGRVRPTMQMKTGVAINDDAGLENEADVMGARALAAGGQVKVSSPTQAANQSASSSAVSQARQLAMQAGMPVQLTRNDASAYIYRHRDAFYGIKELRKSELFDGCKPKGTWLHKWELTFPREKDRKPKLVTLEEHINDHIDREWVKQWVASNKLAPKYRQGLFHAWNEGLEYDNEKSDVEESDEESDKEKNSKHDKSEELNSEDDDDNKGISEDLIADLVTDVSTLDVGKGKKLSRQDSFTFGSKEGAPSPQDLLEKMEKSAKIEIGSEGKQKDYYCTASIALAGMYIRAYGDELNIKGRCASTKFVFDLGGSLGLYRDTTGNGDLFYFPLTEKEDEKNVYRQEGGSTEHTWDKLAGHLSKVKGLDKVHTRLAEVLLNEYKGKLHKSEVIAIGAMLADAKYSIQGWLYAVEQLKKYEFDGETISELFAITGSPFWKYSLNASNELNEGNDESGMGRKAGLGYKKLDLKEQRKEEKKEEKKEKKEEEKTSEFSLDDLIFEKDEEENSSEDEDKYEKKKSPSLKFSFKTKKLEKKKKIEKRKQSELKRKVDKTEFEKKTKRAEKSKRKKNVGKSFSDNEDEVEEIKISKDTRHDMEEEDAGSSNEEDDNDSIIHIEEEEGL
ncbi:DUF4157 domain-containing protein [Undibacterium sp. TJN19]|uniref:eCIS core domain-containing protein n=1 Tax=Undibacterium sp. TJN19 TaxID=3413055 RepID=UPI003BF1FBA8